MVFMVLNFICNCIGITLGYHRFLSHRGFKAGTFFRRFVATCGALTFQNGPLKWVAHHRQHHAFSDQDGDPHDSRRGLIYSHIGWMVGEKTETESPEFISRMTRDISTDPYLVWLNKMSTIIILQAGLAGLLFLFGGWQWLVWGTFLRLTLCYHFTWLINSATHHYGYRRFKTTDNSKNNILTAILTWGEGWHNTHHAFDRCARHGVVWWEIDPTWMIIWTMEKLGIIWDVQRLPEDSHKRAINYHEVNTPAHRASF